MGAASKGIIQRGYQHNAAVYSAPYARNPFDHITDNEIDEYRRDVERKRRGNECEPAPPTPRRDPAGTYGLYCTTERWNLCPKVALLMSMGSANHLALYGSSSTS